MSSSSFPWDRHYHGSMASVTAAQESSDDSSRAVLFDIVRTLQRLESNIQAQHDRLSFFESSIRAESVTTASPTRSKYSFDSQRSQKDSLLTTPPLSPAGERKESPFTVQGKFEFEDGGHGGESRTGMQVLSYIQFIGPKLIMSCRSTSSNSQDEVELEEEPTVVHDGYAYSASNYSLPLSQILLGAASVMHIPRIPSRSPLRPVSMDDDDIDPIACSEPSSGDQKDMTAATDFYELTPKHTFDCRPVTVLSVESSRRTRRKRDCIVLTLEKSFGLYDKCITSVMSFSIKAPTLHVIGKATDKLANGWRAFETDLKVCVYRKRPYQVA